MPYTRSLFSSAWSKDAAMLNAIFAGAIAVATVFYVVFTIALWLATKRAANAATAAAVAAKVSAEAAKQSGDIAAALNRRYMRFARLGLDVT